jgi:hypothetical protein
MRYSSLLHFKRLGFVATLVVVSIGLVSFATHGADYQLTTSFTPRRTSVHYPGIAQSACAGDCDGQGTVTVDEILTMVNIALDKAPISDCQRGDSNGDGRITIDELLAAVNNALNSCARTPTATSTPQQLPTPTSTPSFTCSCDCTCLWCTAHSDCRSYGGTCPGCGEICYDACSNPYMHCGYVLSASGSCGP